MKKKEQKQGLLKTGDWKLENRKQKKKKKKLKYELYMGLWEYCGSLPSILDRQELKKQRYNSIVEINLEHFEWLIYMQILKIKNAAKLLIHLRFI